jgi:hypothetical protein
MYVMYALAPTTGLAILWPFMAHAALVFALYALLTLERTSAIRAGKATSGTFEFGREEPSEIARITRNLANQFELPMLFYAAVLILMQLHAVLVIDVLLGWLFVMGRVVHTAVQTLTGNFPLRGKIFMINFLAVAGLLAHLLVLMISA